MGRQKQITCDITQGKGDYVLALKENHPEVYSEVSALFPAEELGEAESTEINKRHGRIQKREALLYKDIT